MGPREGLTLPRFVALTQLYALLERRTVPLGSVRQWRGGSYKKVSQGRWELLREPRAHGIRVAHLPRSLPVVLRWMRSVRRRA